MGCIVRRCAGYDGENHCGCKDKRREMKTHPEDNSLLLSALLLSAANDLPDQAASTT
jgi:hypothetical protein